MLGADELTKEDKEDDWTWDDTEGVRPLQSRQIVREVIKEGMEGNMTRFYQHFLKDFVVPDEPSNNNQVRVRA